MARARVLLWAQRQGQPPFEVSKIVAHPLQPLCATAPRCAGELAGEACFQQDAPLWVDPAEPPFGSCPYAFARRGDCLSHRNQLALEGALFAPGEVALTRRLLEALGYRVTEESVDPVRDKKILSAHSHLGPSKEIALLHSPAAGPIVLVRERSRPRQALPPLRLEGARTR